MVVACLCFAWLTSCLLFSFLFSRTGVDFCTRYCLEPRIRIKLQLTQNQVTSFGWSVVVIAVVPVLTGWWSQDVSATASGRPNPRIQSKLVTDYVAQLHWSASSIGSVNYTLGAENVKERKCCTPKRRLVARASCWTLHCNRGPTSVNGRTLHFCTSAQSSTGNDMSTDHARTKCLT